MYIPGADQGYLEGGFIGIYKGGGGGVALLILSYFLYTSNENEIIWPNYFIFI